jgi:3-hydroxyisobutyrate dehydrogenase
MMSNALRIGFIGLGNMGVPMVKNLVKAGYRVTVYNRNREKSTLLKQEIDIEIVDNITLLLPECDVIISMLTNDAAVKEVYNINDGLFSIKKTKEIAFVDMSTVSPDTSKELYTIAKEKGYAYLDAPVSGSVKPAAEAQLIVMAGGDQPAFDRVKPIFDTLGKSATLLGGSGSGNVAKLAINLFLGITIQGLSEAVLFAKENGILPEMLLPLINNGPIGSGITRMKTDNLVNEDFKPAFALKLLKKDIGLAKDFGMQTPVGIALLSTLKNAVESGLGEEDMVAIYKYLNSVSQLQQRL